MQYKDYKNVFFVIILFLFVIPPIITSPQGNYIQETINNIKNPYILLTLLLYVVISCFIIHSIPSQKITVRMLPRYFLFLVTGIIVLYFNSLLWNFIFNKNNFTITLPKKGIDLLFLFFFVIISAFFEEALYRCYLPTFIGDILTIILFSLAHRATGISSICNSFIAGLVLCFLYKKGGGLYITFPVHFLYNLFTYISFNWNN